MPTILRWRPSSTESTRDQGRLDILVNNAFRVFGHLDPQVPFWETPISDWDALIDVGSRSAYVATHHAATLMVPARRGLVVNISSAGAVRFFHHIVYGIGKVALDRLTRDAARPLRPYGVAIVSVWPYLVRTERVEEIEGVDLDMAESVQFVGRGIVALATDPDVLARSGTAVTTRSLADDYGFVDIDGSLPPQQPWRPPPGPPVPRSERA
jgi:dehydrogenase/reductase SDR family protein 1